MGCTQIKNRVYDDSLFPASDLPSTNVKSIASLCEIPSSEKSTATGTPSLPNIYNLSSGFCGKITPIKMNQVLFHFDLSSMRFISFDMNTKDWTVNDLTKTRFLVRGEGSAKFDFDIIKDILMGLRNYSLIAIDAKHIELIGPRHFQYNITLNYFEKKPSMNVAGVKNPCLAFTGRRLFAFSGEQKSEYCRNAEVYDMNSNTWTSVEDMPSPHGKGAACCFLSNLNIVKVLIAGGYSQKKPLIASFDLSIYDDFRKGWMTIDIQCQVFSLRAMPNPSIFVTEDGIIHLQETRGGYDHYELKLHKRKLVRKPELDRMVDSRQYEIIRANRGENEEVGFLAKIRQESGEPIRKSAPEYCVAICDGKFKEWSEKYVFTNKKLKAKTCIR